MIFSETPRRQMVSKLVTWGHWFALCNIIVAIFIAGIYLFSSSAPETALGLIYLIANWFSHIGFLTFFGFVILILPVCYLYPNSSILRLWGSAVSAIGLAFLAFDALLYTRHGLHFSFYSADFIKQQTNVALTELGLQSIVFLLISFFIWLLFQLLLANSLWHRMERLQRLKLGLPISAAFIAMFTFSHLTHIWADANLYQPIVKQDNMFPLSYPATAKTLLSKYSLMDLDEYQTKKKLQFDNLLGTVTYPKSTLFCSITRQNPTLVLFVNDGINERIIGPYMDKLNLRKVAMHFDLSSSNEAGFKTALYGLPELFHEELRSESPLLIKLMSAASNQVIGFSQDRLIGQFFNDINAQNTQDIEEFAQLMDKNDSGIFLAHINNEHIPKIIKTIKDGKTNLFLTSLKSDSQVITYSNMPLSGNREISSHQDIAPTLLNLLGCNIPDSEHSTGQNMLADSRNWLVSYHENKIVILHDGLRTIIDPNGNYLLFDYDGNPQTNMELNIPLLGQAVKLLSSFSN